jgi:hypothetical protein
MENARQRRAAQSLAGLTALSALIRAGTCQAPTVQRHDSR